MNQSLQEKYAPSNSCWGCGPANREGLRIRSFPKGDEVVAEWTPETKYEAFPGVLNGGIIGTLLDCHCNWTAAWHLMNKACSDQRRPMARSFWRRKWSNQLMIVRRWRAP